MPENVTVKDIAHHASVSIGTVSRVLNQREGVNRDLRERVLSAASELGYLGIAGQNVRTRLSTPLKEIGFVLAEYPYVANGGGIDAFWAHILHGAQGESRKHEIKVTYLGDSDLGSPHAIVAHLTELRLRAILVVGPADREMVQTLQRAGYLLVLVDNYLPGVAVDAVLSDGFTGAYEATQTLIAAGHRSIAYVGGPAQADHPGSNAVYSIALRASGYRTAHVDAGLTVAEDLQASCDLTPDGGYAACRRLLAAGVTFSAVMCANDKTAIGVIKALHEQGRRVPHDCSVVGFDDIELAQHLIPALTTVHVDKEALGSEAIKLLLARAEEPDTASKTLLIHTTFMARETVASPAKA